MITFTAKQTAKRLVGLCKDRMVVDAPLETQLEIAFSLLIDEGLICESQPQKEAKPVPTFEEIKETLHSIESCSIEDPMKATYALAIGAKTLDDYYTWKISLRLYVDGNRYDHASSEFSKKDILSGDIDLGEFSLGCPTDEIEDRLDEFISDSLSSWNGEDDAEFNEMWRLECSIGCDHDIRAEIAIERA